MHGIDYKLEEYKKWFKKIEMSYFPSTEEWTKNASGAPNFKDKIEKKSTFYGLNLWLY